MNKTNLFYAGVVLVALYLAWSVFFKADPQPPLDVPPPVGVEDVVPSDDPPVSRPTSPVNNCAAIIREYERLKLEKQVLGNDYITPELERAYRRCK